MSASARRLTAVYLLETPLDPARVADVLAGEQSSGTFLRVPGETDDLRARSRATVEKIEELEPAASPSLRSAWLERQGRAGPYRRALVTVSFPIGNIGTNLATLAATVAGNLYDLGEATGLKLMSLALPPDYRDKFAMPRQGIAGTRTLAGRAWPSAARHHHQAECRHERGADRRAGRRALRRRARLHQGR